ncbi:oligopeptide ABC transporter permease [Thermotalea metallivorans]|uniref:Glutathione transport system permease protein GsiD n=1 Tax=Thermotalea metallivorans TaxID=520762 RepID=A0A140KZQ7_9FIRM|nr:oligopeptide ABC transporter permease [Thermotalea metallivorans]KXG73782.1 Glutathione transport system permease protein GsiD [Thermotalea metallivorans]
MEIVRENRIEQKKEKILGPWQLAWIRLKRNRLAMVGLYVLIFMVSISILGPIISPYKMETIDLANISAPPSIAHPLGTDEVGRDILTRVMYAGRISLSVGIVAVFISVVIGSMIGAVSGYYSGIIDAIIMRIVDIFMCFPFLPLLLMIAAVMSDYKINPDYRIYVVMLIIGILSWPGLARIIRGQILSLREQEFIQAAEALGLRDRRKIFRHLLPNTFGSIIVSSTLGVGNAILTESVLSFLGLGVTPPTPSWGNMVNAVTDAYVFQFHPWRWMPPGICIFITVMAINLLGDGLRDAFDSKLKR